MGVNIDMLITMLVVCYCTRYLQTVVCVFVCGIEQNWFERWSFLHYDDGEDVVFCRTCVTGIRQGKMKSLKAE